MCTVLLAWRCVPGADYVIAANRDELVDRAAAPPVLLVNDPLIAGGRDLVAGGTWLAVAADRRTAAVTNRRAAGAPEVERDPSRRSRGEIPVAVLTEVGEQDLPAYLSALGPGRYNPVNVLYVSPARAIVASVDDTGRPRVTELQPGPHVLTVGDVDDVTRAKDRALRARLEQALAAAADGDDLERRLRSVLSTHESPSGEGLDAACIHGDVYGTVSSATAVVADGGPFYRHAQGRPCVTPFEMVRAFEGAA